MTSDSYEPLINYLLTPRQPTHRRSAREKRRGNSRHRNTNRSAESRLQIIRHSRRLISRRGSLDRARNSSITLTSPSLQTEPLAIRRATAIRLTAARLSPHLEILNREIRTRRAVRADNFHRTALRAVGFCASPVGEADIRQLHAGAGDGGHGSPVLVDVEAVGIGVADEVLEGDVRDATAAAVGFDHHHLVGGVGVDVPVDYG